MWKMHKYDMWILMKYKEYVLILIHNCGVNGIVSILQIRK